MGVISTGVIELTTMVKALVSVRGGALLSVTRTWTAFELPALVAVARQLNAPLLRPMLPGPLATLNVSVRVLSLSVAEAVKPTVCPTLTKALLIGARVGA